MSKKNHRRQLAAAKARRQRRGDEVVNSRFVDSPWATWRTVQNLVGAGEIEPECLLLLEHLPYRVNDAPLIPVAETPEQGLAEVVHRTASPDSTATRHPTARRHIYRERYRA